MTELRWNYRIVVFSFFLAFAQTVFGATHNTDQQDSRLLRFAGIPFMGEPPAYIAMQQGFFADEGLELEFKQNPAGKISLLDLFNGRADIITIADTPLVYQTFKRDDFYIIAGVSRSETIAGAVGRRDHGVDHARGIKGKKVGLFKGTGSDYLLDQYLVANDLSYSDIKTVSRKPARLIEGLVAGDLDAIFSWQPHIHNAKSMLGNDAFQLPTTGLKTMDWLIVSTKDFVHKNPREIEKFLRAMDRATEFIDRNRDQSIEIFSKASGIDLQTTSALWDDFAFGLYLSEALLINLEDQARWAQRRNGDDSKIPNYFEYIYLDAMDKVKPGAVSLIR